MNWIDIKRNDYVELECTNPIIGIYVVRFSPTTIKEQINEQSEEDIRVVPVRFTKNPSIDDNVKQVAIELVKEYDKSIEVNSFVYNGNKYWFDKNERVALLNSFNILKEAGETNVTLWLDRTKLILNVDTAISFIQSLEQYAVSCNNVTKEHILQIHSLQTLEAIAVFDITADYPNQLELTI